MSTHLPAKPALAVLATFALAACQTASSPDIRRFAASGAPIQLAHWGNLNPDCTTIGPVVLQVVQRPEHGEVAIRERSGFTFFTKDNPRVVCNSRATPGIDATYVSSPGFVGQDSVTLDIIFTEGTLRRETFAINVR